jgi:hypothetical protein
MATASPTMNTSISLRKIPRLEERGDETWVVRLGKNSQFEIACGDLVNGADECRRS